MRTCIVADPYVLRVLDEEGKPEGEEPGGFLSYFILPLPPAAEVWTPPPADLHVLPAELFLALDSLVRPSPVFAYGRAGLIEESFRLGCADFLRSPWSLIELSARAARLRRLGFCLAGVRLELSGRILESPSGKIALSEAEGRLARILVLNLNSTVPKRALSLALWGSARPASRAIDVHISSLRKKLEASIPGGGKALAACRREGYCLLGEACG